MMTRKLHQLVLFISTVAAFLLLSSSSSFIAAAPTENSNTYLTISRFASTSACTSSLSSSSSLLLTNAVPYRTKTCVTGLSATHNSLYATCNSSIATIQTYSGSDDCTGTSIKAEYSVDECLDFGSFSMIVRCSAGEGLMMSNSMVMMLTIFGILLQLY